MWMNNWWAWGNVTPPTAVWDSMMANLTPLAKLFYNVFGIFLNF